MKNIKQNMASQKRSNIYYRTIFHKLLQIFSLIFVTMPVYSQNIMKEDLLASLSYPKSAPYKKIKTQNELVFISDLQAPIIFERIISPDEMNQKASDSLLSDIAERPKLSSVFMLGDVVRFSFMNSEWNAIDKFLQKINNRKLAVSAIPGNHEYMFLSGLGISKYSSRFGENSLNGYYRIEDSIAVVMLNSNFSNLCSGDDKKQLEWYKEIMDKLDLLPSVKAIIVCTHHAPFTRSKVVSSNKDVQKRFIEKFAASSKAVLFLSGHSHNLEHYQKMDKDFLVIGGGGGLKQNLSSNSSLTDDFDHIAKPRFFYLIVTRENNVLSVTCHGYNPSSNTHKEERIMEIRLNY